MAVKVIKLSTSEKLLSLAEGFWYETETWCEGTGIKSMVRQSCGEQGEKISIYFPLV